MYLELAYHVQCVMINLVQFYFTAMNTPSTFLSCYACELLVRDMYIYLVSFSLLLEGHHFISPLHQLFSSVLFVFHAFGRLTSEERSITGMQHSFRTPTNLSAMGTASQECYFRARLQSFSLAVLFDHAAATLCSRCSPDLPPPVCVQRLRHAAVG